MKNSWGVREFNRYKKQRESRIKAIGKTSRNNTKIEARLK
jgi:hypothetical protein